MEEVNYSLEKKILGLGESSQINFPGTMSTTVNDSTLHEEQENMSKINRQHNQTL